MTHHSLPALLSIVLLAGCATQAQTRAVAPTQSVTLNRTTGNAQGNYLYLPPSAQRQPEAEAPEPASPPAQPTFADLADGVVPSDAPSSAELAPAPSSTLAPEPVWTSSANSWAQPETQVEPLPAVAATVVEQPPSSWVSEPSVVEPAPAQPRRELTSEDVYEAASALPGLAGWTVIPLAHFQRDERHVVVAWPAFNAGGALVDATVVGLCLEETAEGDLEQCGQRWVVNDRDASLAALSRALGGSDYELVRSNPGASLDDLGPRLAQLGTTFASAASSGDRDGARQAAMAFVELLPLDQVAHDNDVAQLLYLAARYNGQLEHSGTRVSGGQATLTFHVRRGFLRVRTIRATATQLAGQPNRWIVTDYE